MRIPLFSSLAERLRNRNAGRFAKMAPAHMSKPSSKPTALQRSLEAINRTLAADEHRPLNMLLRQMRERGLTEIRRVDKDRYMIFRNEGGTFIREDWTFSDRGLHRVVKQMPSTLTPSGKKIISPLQTTILSKATSDQFTIDHIPVPASLIHSGLNTLFLNSGRVPSPRSATSLASPPTGVTPEYASIKNAEIMAALGIRPPLVKRSAWSRLLRRR